ncbi:hypothetical protein FJT64_022063 [Amphibalanus amphitrite]|uniref:Uncharacterized protein n=1 Tax=Amphibalanus amphitrite TaxID=1232801 RepID=A0A6A4WM79_AMPAM|nr:hypothetical protein FJT64_022063 [Amphibalanus amphitrite]
MVSAQVRAHDPLPAPAASAGTNTSYTPFDLAWLDASTRDRLLRGLPFQRNDWCRLVGAIFDSISSTFERTCNRNWYADVTCDLLDRFPHLFAGMSTREAMTFMRTKLRTKAKNTRHRFVQLHRRRSVPQ